MVVHSLPTSLLRARSCEGKAERVKNRDEEAGLEDSLPVAKEEDGESGDGDIEAEA